MAVGEYGQCQRALGFVVDSHQGYVSIFCCILFLYLHVTEKLQTETMREREEFILFILPYVLLTFRVRLS